MAATGEGELRKAERSSHAIYGLIIIASTLVADRAEADDALTSLVVLWGGAVILVLAHLYSAAVAEVGQKGRWLTYRERHLLIADNIPVLAAVVVPTLLLVAAGLDWMELSIALDLAIILSVGALFAVGVYQARKADASAGVQVGLGVLGGFIGVIVIALEVILGH